MELEQVHFRSLASAVAGQLREAIIAGRLKPGERLVEQKLAGLLGTSQPTVREALKELEYQGFVRKTPNKASYVTQLEEEDFGKILQVRIALEVLAIEEAARRMTPEAAENLERAVQEMATAAEIVDKARFHRADLQFHTTIWELAGNEYLVRALERVIFTLFAFVLLGQEKSDFLSAVQQHRDILKGLLSGDAVKAKEAFVSSTLRFWGERHMVRLNSGGG